MCCVCGSSPNSASQSPHQLLVDLQIASLPKENGARCRTVVITQGALPTVVASQGKVSLCESVPVTPEMNTSLLKPSCLHHTEIAWWHFLLNKPCFLVCTAL